MKKVDKIWGGELWIVNRDYCGKILYLNKGSQCSLHYHKKKDETFYILKGKVEMEIKTNKRIHTCIMEKGNSIEISPGTMHRFKGLKKSEILEISTHHEDDDSFRIEVSKK